MLRRNQLIIENAKPEHSTQIHRLMRAEFGVAEDELCDECMPAEAVARHIRRFPEGQFVALIDGKVVGFAITLRTHKPPTHNALPWLEAIGGLYINKHQPGGDWLYGVDFAVDRSYRKRGIGTGLYKARFQMVRRLNLRGFYAGGMLVNYDKYQHDMSLQEYGRKVMCGEIRDSTVSMQLNRGFKPSGVIEHYTGNTVEDNAMLIIWDNPQYQAAGAAAG